VDGMRMELLSSFVADPSKQTKTAGPTCSGFQFVK